MKKTEIWKLYQSVLTGASQCHLTGNEKHSSGGWYTFVCPHGVIYAARLLFLRESVRDPGINECQLIEILIFVYI